MNETLAYLRAHRQPHLDALCDFCRIPSISTGADHVVEVRRAIEWLADFATCHGLSAEILETGGHPALVAEHCHAPGAPTYLVYGHADVQPTGERALWHADPFEPVVQDGRLICRGSADNKGPLMVHLRAAAAFLATQRKLPVNLKFLIEGEEEIGSPHLAALIEKERNRLRCDHVLISDTGMYAAGWPTITYGTRGCLLKEIRVYGPKHDMHSGSFGGTIANPAHVLARIVAGLHDAHGRVAIPGFYDDVVELSPAERDRLRALPLDVDAYLADVGSPAIVGEAGFSTNERRWIRPTLEVNGIYGGFTGAGSSTIVPASAGAKISMRLVPEQRGEGIGAQFDAAVRGLCPDTVRLEILSRGHADAYVAPTDSREMAAAEEALRTVFGRNVALIREGGSLPILPMFRKLLGADSLLIGFAHPNCAAHGPNENIILEDLDRGAEAIVHLLTQLGGATGGG